MTEEKKQLITEQLATYYAVHATAYEQVYARPERQPELAELHARLADVLRGHRVLELACGSGYWTGTIAACAALVLATDVNPEMLALAGSRGLDPAKVGFRRVDAFNLPDDLGSFTACFAGMWWSHVKREEQEKFLAHLRARLGKDVMLVLLDNTYVEGSSSPIARTDLEGNTYQIRTASDGQRYEVLKNFPSDSTLRKKLGGATREIRLTRMEYYWLLSCRLK